MNGHEHHYERFAPQSPEARSDPKRGIRQFVVGTGGASLYPFGLPLPGSEVRIAGFGVLVLTLLPGSYRWRFVDPDGRTLDRGAGTCHCRTHRA